tara:strand:+ start:872 stop:2131 length:1260 start_codon:yes stop_codon:yes gene_type:complete
MPKNKKYNKKYTFLKSQIMAKKYSIGFYTGGKNFDINKAWYLRWSFRSPISGKLERQKNYKGGVNYFKTKDERLKVLEEYKKGLTELITDGYSPYNDAETIVLNNEKETIYSISKAFKLALDQLALTVSKTTINDYRKTARSFLKYIGKENHHKEIKLIDKKIVVKYLNEILKNTSARTRNNYKADLSSIFTVMEKKLMIIDYNFIKTIEKEKTQIKRNRTLTNEQLKNITEFLKVHDPVLLLVIKFVSYNFLRPIEVCRIKIKDINLKESLIYYQAKNKPLKTKRIPDILLKELKEMNLHTYNKDFYLITPSGVPNIWNSSDTQRRSAITKRFTRLKIKMLNFGIELERGDNIYSFRHSYITNLFRHLRTVEKLSFNNAIKELMPITGHDSESGLKNYIHTIDADIPPDWSNKIDVII